MSRLRQVFHPTLQSTNNTGSHRVTDLLKKEQVGSDFFLIVLIIGSPCKELVVT